VPILFIAEDIRALEDWQKLCLVTRSIYLGKNEDNLVLTEEIEEYFFMQWINLTKHL